MGRGFAVRAHTAEWRLARGVIRSVQIRRTAFHTARFAPRIRHKLPQRIQCRRIRCDRFLIDDSVRAQRVILIDRGLEGFARYRFRSCVVTESVGIEPE